MNDFQHTLKGSAVVKGVGLHTGKPATLTLRPAPVGHGYKFQRTDLEGEPIIDADADLVVSTARGTTLGKGDITVNTTEHVLSALYALGVDNCLLQVSSQNCRSSMAALCPLYVRSKKPVWSSRMRLGTGSC